MKNRTILIFALAAVASGCVRPPKTADGFRQLAASGSMWAKVEKFEVNRPYQEVARTFHRRSEACLKVRVVTRSSGGYMRAPSTFRRDYRPAVTMDRRRAEFTVQIHIQGTNMIRVYSEAKGGDYVMVADAYPVSRKKTRIELHGVSIGHSVLMKTVRGWATGSNLGCPDLTK